jgi:hypothetical protein
MVLPCGCAISTGIHEGIETFMLQACSETCTVVRDSLKLADELDKPVQIKSRSAVTCLNCQKVMDAFKSTSEALLPDPGSVSICFYCGDVAMFDINPDGDLYLRPPSLDEWVGLEADQQLMDIVAKVRERL